MEENNIIEGPKVEPILGETSLGELTLLLLNTHGENILQVSFTVPTTDNIVCNSTYFTIELLLPKHTFITH